MSLIELNVTVWEAICRDCNWRWPEPGVVEEVGTFLSIVRRAEEHATGQKGHRAKARLINVTQFVTRPADAPKSKKGRKP